MKTRSRSKSDVAPSKPLIHYTADYLINPVHPVTINVIGCGGTGSQVLNSLARMNSALKALGHPGLFIRAIDPDRVTEANMGRQLFSSVDIGSHKAVALISKINRFFGYEWEAVTDYFNNQANVPPANITISCVDTGAARKEIKNVLFESAKKSEGQQATPFSRRREGQFNPFNVPYYWMDFGNTMDYGQVVLGTLRPINQPKSQEYSPKTTLRTVEKLHPEIFVDKKGEDQGPSCSLAEALDKQDLFINTNLANMGLGLLWKMFRETRIQYHGLYLNLKTMITNPIKIK